MDTSKNEIEQYDIGNNEVVKYINSIVNGT